ncbi:MAG TPA: hypothetical protein VMZ91_04530 [Candidatus Paceibacterota bacterium]|nr:hypothetical protein [Candidatus Paceibacterota bacterium]
MANWYKKIANRGNIPKSEDFDERTRDPYKPTNNIMTMPPFPAGRTEKRKGYPQGYSSIEEKREDDNVADLPHEPILMPEHDTERSDEFPPPGEGANDERFVDEIEKKPLKQKPEPVGPHNMPHGKNIFDFVAKRSKMKNINKI